MPFDWHFTKSRRTFHHRGPRGNKKYASEEWSTERPFSEAKRASHCRCPRSWTLESLASFQTPQRNTNKQTSSFREIVTKRIGFWVGFTISTNFTTVIKLLDRYCHGTILKMGCHGYSSRHATWTCPCKHVPTAMVGLIRINLMLDWLQFNHFFWGI